MRLNRSLIFHILYAAEENSYEVSLESIADMLNRGFDTDIDLAGPEMNVTHAIVEQRNELDMRLVPLLANWKIERIGVCTKLILRLALWELLNTDNAPSLVINEAIELAKCFAEVDAYKFVNGVLDEALKKIVEKKEVE
ncbi:transcription antitermination factor NusB [Candidatus Babeliales bacterium]|nr:transcription antitermination factor NusB [Candidatus Babeliales bacterium]